MNLFSNSLACGEPKKATPTIVRGENFVRGDFPWMVALYRHKLGKTRPEYICGGSVISDHHVLTGTNVDLNFEFKLTLDEFQLHIVWTVSFLVILR